tara:strand:+ start:239 stop:1168 length:930 start_codon:yes stop_codon:yes gene_type:complete
MNLQPIYQTKLYGLNNFFLDFIRLYQNKNLPNKILLSGDKGLGKSTLAYHLINYALSKDEEFNYDVKNFEINRENKSYKLTINGSNPNINVIDTLFEKKNIDIAQIRDLISKLNKSSFDNDDRFIIVDNIEHLNVNSINALLKVLEEPPPQTFFILINNDRFIMPTLKSRCINYKIFLNHDNVINITNKLLGDDVFNRINQDLLNYYSTPGKICRLITFFESNDYDLKKYNLKDFLKLIIKDSLYKKNVVVKNILFEYVELFLRKNISNIKINPFDAYNYFVKKINDTKKFNLDEESLFMEFEYKILNG